MLARISSALLVHTNGAGLGAAALLGGAALGADVALDIAKGTRGLTDALGSTTALADDWRVVRR
jgi:hypothetical protein